MINMQMRCSQYDMLTNSIKYSIRVVPSEANQSNDVKVYPVFFVLIVILTEPMFLFQQVGFLPLIKVTLI